VLNLRVGWLVNNIVGNHFLYALQFGGVNGARAYANLILRTRGATVLRRMLNVKDPDGISAALMREFFPEQVGGTFLGSQTPAAGSLRKGLQGTRTGRALNRAGTGLAKDRPEDGGGPA
jgi:hypothetical protein